MSVQIALPDDLAEQIDHVTKARTAFVAEAVRRLLPELTTNDEVARINEVAEELNREAEDVLEYCHFVRRGESGDAGSTTRHIPIKYSRK